LRNELSRMYCSAKFGADLKSISRSIVEEHIHIYNIRKRNK
jgi:hypothetical protein